MQSMMKLNYFGGPMKRKSNIEIKIGDRFTIYIDGLLHLSLQKEDILHVQSWIKTKNKFTLFRWCCKFNIDYHIKSGQFIETGYNDRDTWIKILNQLNEFLR